MVPSTPSLATGFALASGAAVGMCLLLAVPLLPALGLLGVYAGITWPRGGEAAPRGGLGPANAVTLVRAALVALLAAWALGLPELPPLLLAGLAALTFGLDGLDGLVARRTGSASAFGASLDMELDALAVFVFGLLAWRTGACGPWILLAGAWRYLFVAAGWIWPWMRAPLDDFAPRRVACGLQLGALVLALALPQPWALAACAGGFAVLTASFARDTAWLWRHR